jgi:hypothetical protein
VARDEGLHVDPVFQVRPVDTDRRYVIPGLLSGVAFSSQGKKSSGIPITRRSVSVTHTMLSCMLTDVAVARSRTPMII